MRKLVLSLAALAVVIATENRSHAGFMFGAQAFSSSATTSVPNGNSIGDSDFNFNFFTETGGANQTGDFVGVLGGPFANTIDTALPIASLVFGSASYGFFVADAVLVNSSIPGVSRTISLHGTFAPNDSPAGAFFPADLDPTPGILTITINTANVGGNVVLSASATLAVAQEIPEPSTIVLLATGCGTIGLVLMGRRRTQTRSTVS